MHIFALFLLFIIFYIEYLLKEEFNNEEIIVKSLTTMMIVIGSIM